MNKPSIAILSMLALAGPTFGQSAAEVVSGPGQMSGVYRHSQDSPLKDLTLATNEVCYIDQAGKLQIEPVASGSTSALLSTASQPNGGKYLVFYPKGKERDPRERRILKTRYLVTLSNPENIDLVRERCGIKSIQLLQPGSKIAVCEEESAGKVVGQLRNVLSDPDVVAAEPLLARQRYPRLIPTDPFYNSEDNPRDDENYQWYLNNEGINGAVPDIDINIEGAYDRATGDGVTIAVIDDGLATDHTDLVNNAVGPHLNLRDGDPADPATLDPNFNHGTNVAGLIGASFNNGEGIAGAAPNADLSGIRLLGEPVDDAEEAQALTFSNDVIDIYNSGYGPDDTTLNLERPGPLTLQALASGAENGRGGLGSIFVWPAGNGGEIGDNSNYDGYANSRFTIAVGAVGDNGARANYSERGSNLVVVAPSSGGAQNMLTTSFALGVDEDDNPIRVPEYDPNFAGTSASAALVSGVVALMLEENENLTWRDVQDILIRTAFKVDEGDGEWSANAAGIEFNPNYGAGMVDAQAAVAEAFTIGDDLLGPPVRGLDGRAPIISKFFLSDADPNSPESGLVPDNTGDSFLAEFDLTEAEIAGPNGPLPVPNMRVEHVELSATIITERRSDLEIVLISPNGTQSVLQEVNEDHDEQSINRWTFTSVRNWGEGSAGTWVVRVTDRISGNAATVNNMSLVVNGSVDPDAPVSQIPLLTSTRFLSVNQGSFFSYVVQTTGATSVEVGDLPPGVTYEPTTQIISGTPTEPGLFFVPVVLRDAEGAEGVFDIRIVVNPTAVALGDAVGLPDQPAVFEGDLPWDFELADTNDGPDVTEPSSARSAVNLGDNEVSIFGFDGLPPGIIYFDWKTSSEEGADRLWFNRGQGSVPQVWDGFISGERQWGTAAVALPDPSNNVRWIYSKNETDSVGEDRGLVDNVELVPMEKYLEDIARAGNIEGLDIQFDSRTLFFPYEFPGGSPSPDGTPELLRSSTIGNGQTVALSATLEGPGRLSFRAFNFGEPADVLELLVDGVVVESRIGAGPGLTPPDVLFANQAITPGKHWIQIRYRKDFRGSDARTLNIPGIANPLIDGILLDDLQFVADNNFNAFAAQFGEGAEDPEGDLDHDGYLNHYEYAFGGNIAVADVPRYLPRVIEVGDSSFVEFGIDTSRKDLVYLPQQSKDLVNWEDAQLFSLDRVEGDVEVYRIPVASGPGRRNLFYRVVAATK